MIISISCAVPFLRQIWVAPLRPKSSILHWSDHKICFKKPSSLFKFVFVNPSLDFKCVFFNKWVLRGLRDFTYRSCRWSSLFIVLLQTFVPFLIRSVCSSCRVTKGLFLTVRIICRRFLSEIFRGVPDFIIFSVVTDYSFHFFTMNPTVL